MTEGQPADIGGCFALACIHCQVALPLVNADHLNNTQPISCQCTERQRIKRTNAMCKLGPKSTATNGICKASHGKVILIYKQPHAICQPMHDHQGGPTAHLAVVNVLAGADEKLAAVLNAKQRICRRVASLKGSQTAEFPHGNDAHPWRVLQEVGIQHSCSLCRCQNSVPQSLHTRTPTILLGQETMVSDTSPWCMQTLPDVLQGHARKLSQIPHFVKLPIALTISQATHRSAYDACCSKRILSLS